MIGPITAPITPVAVGTSITASANFTYDNTADTHTAVFTWGDGVSSSGAVTESNGSGSVTGNHTYTTAGVYEITLTVTGQSGASGQSVFDYVVVYDPAAGFVTGGGWIISPAG
ncbi:MAG: PKD domain-containing protein, partial [Gemmatimonadaceae bacterium]